MNKSTDSQMPVQFLKGVGPQRARIFEKLGVETAADILEYYPRDYVFVPETIKIEDVLPEHTVAIKGIVESTDFHTYRRKPFFEVYLTDETSSCRIIWFNAKYLQSKITAGMQLVVWGKVSLYKHQMQLTNPKFTVIESSQAQDGEVETLGGAVYPATADLTSRQIKKIIHNSLDDLLQNVPEFFDAQFLKNANLISRRQGFEWIHRPKDEQQVEKAKRRLKYDELFLMQTALAARKYKVSHFSKAPMLQYTEKIDSHIRKRFPFLLTADQDEVIAEVVKDLQSEIPTNRLIQGDVGSGKTVVALYAALLAVANGRQAAIMAPTEILAAQHFTSIERYLKNSRVKRALLTGGMNVAERKEIIDDIKNGSTDIIVGTVALLQDDIKFKNLAVVVIDEQHKFGVHQRAQLRKQKTPHCLVMTATPIPRTLAMTVFGDLDVSIIKSCPPGRGQVITRDVNQKDLPKVYEFIRERLKAKKQAYFVYPRIVESDSSDIKAAVAEYENLSKNIFPEFKIALLHGQMSGAQKQSVMKDFSKGKIDVLVSTVLIEVGIDVPNATIMVIEGADRFGLAQLHQLRGRIARSSSRSYCILVSQSQSEIVTQRLDVMTRSCDGFEIAEQDLKIRGPGELLSNRQHGLPDFKIADIIADSKLLQMARKDAFKLVEDDAMLNSAEHKNIRAELLRKFGQSLSLVDIA